MKSFFTTRETSKVTGISYRGLLYWDKTNLVKPSFMKNEKYRLYTFSDLFQIRFCKILKENGISLPKIRKSIEVLRKLLPQISQPLRDLTFLFEGDKILVFNGDIVTDELSEETFIKFRVRDLQLEVEQFFPPMQEKCLAKDFN